MGWSLPWVSSANTDFNVDFGASSTEEQLRDGFQLWIRRHDEYV